MCEIINISRPPNNFVVKKLPTLVFDYFIEQRNRENALLLVKKFTIEEKT